MPPLRLPPAVSEKADEDMPFYFSTGGCANGTPAGMRVPVHSNTPGKRRMGECAGMDTDGPDSPKAHRNAKEARWESAVTTACDPQLDASLELARRLQAEEDALAERRRAQAKAAALLAGVAAPLGHVPVTDADLTEAIEGMDEDDTGLFNLSPRDFKNEHYNPAHGYWSAAELGLPTTATPPTEQVMEFRCNEAMDEELQCVEVTQPVRPDAAAAPAAASGAWDVAWLPLMPVASESYGSDPRAPLIVD